MRHSIVGTVESAGCGSSGRYETVISFGREREVGRVVVESTDKELSQSLAAALYQVNRVRVTIEVSDDPAGWHDEGSL